MAFIRPLNVVLSYHNLPPATIRAVITTPSSLVDAVEQRDAWRSIWQVVTGDALAGLLSALLLSAGAAALVLPQAPAAGVSSPIAYSQWQALAQAQAGSAYTVLLNLGLFGVAQSFWVRLAAWLLVGVLMLRLADRGGRLAMARRSGGRLVDESRWRVSDHAPSLDEIAGRLSARRYRVAVAPPAATAGDPSWLCADRAPWAEGLSILAHVGALVILAGAALNAASGWEFSRAQVDSDAPAMLRDGELRVGLAAADLDGNMAVLGIAGAQAPITLTAGGRAPAVMWAGRAWPCCLALELDELTREYQVDAQSAGGQPLSITLSSYAAPSSGTLLTFRRGESERSFAVEPAGLALIVSARPEGDRVRAFTMPAGSVLTDTLVRPSLAISGTTLLFRLRAGAIISVRYQPGIPLLIAGGALAVIGIAGALIHPIQRIVVRRHGAWTEFYAAGRRVRPVVREISAPAEAPAPAPVEAEVPVAAALVTQSPAAPVGGSDRPRGDTDGD